MNTPTRAERIADDIRSQITSGKLSPGMLLPSEPDLASQHGVSRTTIRSALRTLENERLVFVRPRRGWIVANTRKITVRRSEYENPDHTVLTSSDAWETDMENQGFDPSHTTLYVAELDATEFLADYLQVPVGTPLIGRYRVRHLDGKPAALDDDFFVEDIVHGTEMAAPHPTTREDILKEAGYEQTTDVDENDATMPTLDQAQRLHLGTNEPLTRSVRTAYTPWGQPVRVNIFLAPGITLRYVLPT